MFLTVHEFKLINLVIILTNSQDLERNYKNLILYVFLNFVCKFELKIVFAGQKFEI